MHRILCLLICVGGLSGLARAHKPAPSAGFDVLQALPSGPDINIELVVLVKDLHRYNERTDAFRAQMQRFAPMQALLSPENQTKLYGFDLLKESRRLATLMAPSGGPASVALVLFTRSGLPSGQLVVKAESGFQERLSAEVSGDHPPPWTTTFDGQTVSITVGDGLMTLSGQVEGGWLRLAPDSGMPVGSAGEPAELFSEEMASYVERCDAALLIRPGMFTTMLAGLVENPIAQSAIRSLDSALIGFEISDEKTTGMRVVVESESLSELSKVARRPGMQNWFVPVADSHATSLFAVSLPPSVVEFGLQSAGESGLMELQSGAELLKLLADFDGRIGYVAFDSPGDWGLAMHFRSHEAASAFAPLLQKVIVQALNEAGARENEVAKVETFSGLKSILHLRSDNTVDGFRIAALGETVVAIPRKARLSRLAALQSSRVSKIDSGFNALTESPITPGIKHVLARPAMALGYTLASGDGGTFEVLALPAKLLSILAGSALEDVLALPMLTLGTESSLDSLALAIAAAQIGWLMTYDVAMAIDVRDNQLVLELFSSQL